MIRVRPQEYTKVSFDSEVLQTLAQRALEGVAALPDDLDVVIEIDENQATNRVRITSMDPLGFAVDGGAVENYKQPRTVGDLPSGISFCRLFLEVVDRQSSSFGAPPLEESLTHAHRMAWNVNLFGRTSRHGYEIHQPRYRYNFRNRHGFSDLADRTFDRLWDGEEFTWAEITAMSDAATDAVRQA